MSQALDVELRSRLAGRVCFIAIGNPDHGDDGFGPSLGEALEQRGLAEVVLAGTTPEAHTGQVRAGGWDAVILLDAVEVGAAPGAVVVLSAEQLVSRFPQFSTHKLSLGTLARLIEADEGPKVSLLGAQPASLKGPGLSPVIEETVRLLAELLDKILSQTA